MTGRCLSTLVELPREGYSSAALRRLADRRTLPERLPFTRRDILRIRAEETARFSISGVQDKVSLRLRRGRLEPTEEGGEYILKPIPGLQLPEFQDDVPANEHVSMQAAEQLFGIRTAANGLIRLADEELAYLTRRFDRLPDGTRIPQEDFCQLMQRSEATYGSNFKYDSSCEALGLTLRRYCAAYPIEVEELFRRLVFSYAIGNGDAHLKNFSLQQGPRGDYLLSPAYDLLSSTLHLPTESRLALDLLEEDETPAGVATAGFETGSDFLTLASRFGIRDSRARQTLKLVDDRREALIDLVHRSFLSEPAKAAYIDVYEDRVKALRQQG